MREVFIVAGKELRDFFTGKQFIVLMAIMLFLVAVGLLSGLQEYNKQLDKYKLGIIAPGPSMPSILTYFFQFYYAFNVTGVILAIIMGHDLISSERESGSLRMLLARPTYRDSVINGKAFAGIVAIAGMMACIFLVLMALLMMSGMMPSGDELYRLIAYFLVTTLFMTAVFMVSLMMSVFCRSSKTAILVLLCLFVVMSNLSGAVDVAADLAMGPTPSFPLVTMPLTDIGMPADAVEDPSTLDPDTQAALQVYNEATAKYMDEVVGYLVTQKQLTDLADLVSPIGSYHKLTAGILNKQKPYDPADVQRSDQFSLIYGQLTLGESMSYLWGNVIALLVMIVAAFGVSYVAFMRLDV
jgi:ABC-type transport system involved in multi-copper enzyme maturation, permease component